LKIHNKASFYSFSLVALLWSSAAFSLENFTIESGNLLTLEDKSTLSSELKSSSVTEENLKQSLDLILLKLGHHPPKYAILESDKKINISILSSPSIIIDNISINIENISGDILDYAYSSFIVGTNFNQYKYTDFKEKIIEMLSNSGYINAAIRPSTRVEIDEDNKAYVYIDIDPGKKYSIGSITFKSNEFDDKFLDNLSNCICIDKEYSKDTISDLYGALNQTRLFGGTEIYIDPKQVDHTKSEIPININLKPISKNKYIGKIGYSSNEGAIAAASWQHRRNSMPGHIFQTKFLASKLNYEARLSYKIPGHCPISQSLLFEFGYNRAEPNETISRTSEAIASYIDKEGFFEKKYSMKVFSERFQITDTSSKKHSKYFLPNVSLKHRYKKGSSSGFYALSARLSFDFLLSSSSLFQIAINNYHIQELNNNFSIHLRSHLATTFFENKEYSTPPSLKLFSGGDSSVRGYAYNSLGPRITSESGKSIVIGGDKKIELSGELQYKLRDGFGIAAFIDAGNSMNKWEPLAWGTGIGARYNLEFGQLKLDIAKPLNHRGDKKNVRIHLSFISSF
jgi:translocation and assembly module TamA